MAAVAVEAGITFCFAAAFHPALRHAAVPRRELGIGTTFNFLGPLANPVKPAAQAIGCADIRMAPVMAGVFAGRGVDAWVFRGDDGLDELTTTGTSSLWVAHGGAVTTATIDPQEFGIALAPVDALRGGDVRAQRRRRTPAARRRAPARCGTPYSSMRERRSPCTTRRARRCRRR